MGKTSLNLNEMLFDLKAAARLGVPEALDMALAALDDWPAFVANARLKEEDVAAILVPLGEVLAQPAVPETYLRMLAAHPLAGARALAASALALRALRGGKVPRKLLPQLAADKRLEVRHAVITVLQRHGVTHSAALLALLREWLTARRSPRLAATALAVLQALTPTCPQEALALLAALPPAQRNAPEVQPALGDALRQMAAAGHAEDVLALLEQWQADGLPAEAVLRALRGEWVYAQRERVAALLDALEAQTGPSRALRRSRQHLGEDADSAEDGEAS